MKWAIVGSAHWNTDLIKAFTWSDGRLAVWWLGEAEGPEIIKDRDRALYLSLCRALGVAPVEVVADGKSRP